MGHRKTHAPRHGSLAYLPRHRAKRSVARVRFWPKIDSEKPRLLGFLGYKAGVTHVFKIEDRKRSPNFGKEIMSVATILETPPILVCAIRAYTKDVEGIHSFSEAWMKDPPDDLDRALTLPENSDADAHLKTLEEKLTELAKIRVIVATQPRQTAVPKKKPDFSEIEVGGGSIQLQLEYARSLLGRTISPAEIFKDGEYVDVLAISTGKGFQGPVKRWGVTKLQHKGRKTKRGIATLGPWNPHHVMYSIARAGQMGYHQRTEYNKRILKIGLEGKEVTPNGGFMRYGIIKGPYIILEGTVAGPEKRSVKLRYPARPPKNVGEEPPQITQVSLESPQGK